MLLYGLKVALLGMGTVFTALYLLMNLIILQSRLLAPKPKANIVEAPKETTPNQSLAQPVQETENDDMDEIAAVIAAAVAACGHQVVIKTISRINGIGGATWSASGRTEVMNLRQLSCNTKIAKS